MATAPTYDYNTGKLLAPGQQQSAFNSQTGQKIADPSAVPTKAPSGQISLSGSFRPIGYATSATTLLILNN